MTNLITYETLFEILQKEKARKELQKLEENFNSNFIRYLDEKASILNSQKSKDSIFSNEVQKTEKQVENIRKIIKDLYERRERKIVEAALFSSRNPKKVQQLESAMLPEEKDLFENLTKNLSNSRELILGNLLEGKKPEINNNGIVKEEGNILIKFTSAVPKFIGPDENTYGPFEREDVSSLPIQISAILVSKKRAEKLEIDF